MGNVTGVPAGRHGMFIALSTFAVANGKTEEVKQAFLNRPHHVDHVSGFVRMEVIIPVDTADEIWLLTYWENEESYQRWHHSDEHHLSHRGIPKGLKLVPQSVRLRFFHHLSS